jgi:hypothetical protein
MLCDNIEKEKVQVLYKNQLRGLYQKENNKAIEQIIDEQFTRIFDNVILNSKINIHELHFMIFCNDEYIKNILPGVISYTQWNNIYNFPLDISVSKILQKLKNTFPDSNIIFHKTQSDKKNCDYYTLSW